MLSNLLEMGYGILAQFYSLNECTIETLLNWVKNEEIVIPEIQRPFLWKATQVRDFINSLYRGYPVGYLITWLKSGVRLRRHQQSTREYILIDGQQRVMALWTALLGETVLNKKYERQSFKIAFHPVDEIFEEAKATHSRDSKWISDISTIFTSNVGLVDSINAYCNANSDVNRAEIENALNRLSGIRDNSLGVIKLDTDLKVETVAEIFNLINSTGVRLTSPDFIMSKMASSERYNSHQLRKSIDYFCHLAASAEAFNDLASDTDFANTHYFRAMEWLKDWNDDLYVPDYTDMLKVVFTAKFGRGDIKDLVPRLSGNTAEDSFRKLEDGILKYMNEHNFKNFILILRSTGFIDRSMIKAKNAINFAYILYLTLREENADEAEVKRLVSRWFVMSVLTGRYSGEPQATFGRDIRGVTSGEEVSGYLERLEQTELSEAFWDVEILDKLNTSTTKSVYFNMFLASQIKENDKGFLSRDIPVRDLLGIQGDIHHIFPQNYLRESGITRKKDQSQIANLVVMRRGTNIRLSDTAPSIYFSELQVGLREGEFSYGDLEDPEDLQVNFKAHCIPFDGVDASIFENYSEFLKERRKLMATKIRNYYFSL